LFVLLIVGVATSAIAGDEPAQAQTSPDSRQGVVDAFTAPGQTFGRSSGLIFAEAKPRDSNQPAATVVPLAKLDDGLCYTMRLYKLKRTERVSEGETVSRGYSTCELASNYQFRSAVAHVRTLVENDASKNERQK
jgi:hypothetical protein